MAAEEKLPIGVLISGSGTNLQILIDRIVAGTLDAKIVVVISNKEDAYGLTRAKEAGIPTVFLDPKSYTSPHEYSVAIAETLKEYRTDLVVMAGYMKLLGNEVLDAFPNKVINLHPALLPSFVGAHAIQDAYDYGVKISGITVHFANDVFDEGAIIAQKAVRIEEDDTVDTFEAKIHEAEYQLLPDVIQLIAEGRVSVDGHKVNIKS